MKQNLKFIELARVFLELEETSSSLKMIDILADLFNSISPEEAKISAYLLRGEVSPSYLGQELGFAEKMIMRALSMVSGQKIERGKELFNREGDIGLVAEILLKDQKGKDLTLQEVFKELKELPKITGTGSQKIKLNNFAELLKKLSSLEARYICRLVVGALRLGVGEMTFLYGLSKALTGSKEGKKVLEKAYNVLSDLGEVAYFAKKQGIKSLEKANPMIGVPIRMMLAERIEKLEDFKEHIKGEVFVEYKYDGERIQTHIDENGRILLFSRRHENITHQFPDIVLLIKKGFLGKNAIFEGEAAPIDPKSGKLLPFQILMTRRRKHRIEEYAKKVPVKYFIFDILYLNNRSLLGESLSDRKALLEKSFKLGRNLQIGDYVKTEELDEIESYFSETLKAGAEGVMIKSAESSYEAGKRGWKWIKFKKEYKEELADTFDLVVVGGIYGTGRRAKTYGSLLLASFDPKTNKYYSLTKVGAGFTDKDLESLPRKLDKFKLKEKHRLLETGMDVDVWFEPQLVVEVSGAEITVSPVHTVAKEKTRKGGLALRFPIFLRWREDKSPNQATTVEEIYKLYEGSK